MGFCKYAFPGSLGTYFHFIQFEANRNKSRGRFLTRHTFWGILGRFETIVFLLSSPSHTSTFLRCSHCCPPPFRWIMELESQPNWSNCLLGSHTAGKKTRLICILASSPKLSSLLEGRGGWGKSIHSEIPTFHGVCLGISHFFSEHL